MSYIQAALQLWSTGDYTGAMRPALGEEDSPLVDIILTARETWRV